MAARRRQGREAGYNMVMLIVAITVLNILVAAVLPLMSTQIRREKEEELIFRGFQYAEAIRLFHVRFQHYPTKLEQLLEVKPRCIRQLWKDPMTKDGQWGLLFQGQGRPITLPTPGGGTPDPNNPEGQPLPTGDNGGPNGTDPNGRMPGDPNNPNQQQPQTVGPIVGVYSKSPQKSFLIFYGHNRYDEWRFSEDLLQGLGNGRGSVEGAPGIGNPGQVVIPNFSTRWLGRPLPFFNQSEPQLPQPIQGQGPSSKGPQPKPGQK